MSLNQNQVMFPHYIINNITMVIFIYDILQTIVCISKKIEYKNE